MSDYTIRYNNSIIRQLGKAQTKALLKTANSILVDTSAKKVVPFDSSIMEASGKADRKGEDVVIHYSAPYTEYQYFDITLKHEQGPHAFLAEDHWLDPYMNGGTEFDFVVDKYKAHYTNELRRIHL
jgi:hypothetical protein